MPNPPTRSQAQSVTERGKRVAAVVLAAGGATRMGRPKALLDWNGVPLVRHLVAVAQASGCASTRVVAGEHASEIGSALEGVECDRIDHPGWRDGLGSSIAAGVRSLPGDVEAVILLLCDQPFTDTQLLDALIDTYIEGRNPVASRYGEASGPPVLFARRHFAALEALRGDAGAKAILREAGEDVAHVDFPEGAIDLDTPEDYDRALALLSDRDPETA